MRGYGRSRPEAGSIAQRLVSICALTDKDSDQTLSVRELTPFLRYRHRVSLDLRASLRHERLAGLSGYPARCGDKGCARRAPPGSRVSKNRRIAIKLTRRRAGANESSQKPTCGKESVHAPSAAFRPRQQTSLKCVEGEPDVSPIRHITDIGH